MGRIYREVEVDISEFSDQDLIGEIQFRKLNYTPFNKKDVDFLLEYAYTIPDGSFKNDLIRKLRSIMYV
jgi:hypothetical protein